MLKQVLTHYGYQVHMAHTGFEALEAAGTFQPRVVISDIGLPDGTGLDLMRAVRKRHANTALPPVLILQATDDAATPYHGGATVHRLLAGSALVVESGSGNHGRRAKLNSATGLIDPPDQCHPYMAVPAAIDSTTAPLEASAR